MSTFVDEATGVEVSWDEPEVHPDFKAAAIQDLRTVLGLILLRKAINNVNLSHGGTS